MYNSFFSLKENPFNLTPDPRFLYLSTYHKDALDSLLRGINERKGLITITGDIGTGKTTLCRVLLSQLDASTKSALVFNSFISDMELLEILIQEFGIDKGAGQETLETNMDALNRFLLQNDGRGQNAVLLIDEAQNLPHSVLQQLLTLSRLQKGEDNLIQIILMGQSELNENLADPVLKSFAESIALRHKLKPLDPRDIQGYIKHRLEVAGGTENVTFADGVFDEIYANSQGNPRRINAICDRALLIGYVEGEHTLTAPMIEKAAREIRGTTPRTPTKALYFARLRSVFLFFLLPLMVVTISGWTLRDRILGFFSNDPGPATIRIDKPLNPSSEKIEIQEQSIFPSPDQVQSPPREETSETPKPESAAVNLTPVTEEPVMVEAPEQETGIAREGPVFSVQVGAFKMEKNAKNLLAKLTQKGYKSSIAAISDYSNKLWYSVRIREGTNLEDARQAALDYREKEGKLAIVTKEESLDPVALEKEPS